MTALAEACTATLYVLGLTLTGRWAAREDSRRRWYGSPDVMGITAAAVFWPLTWFLVGGYLALCWLFGIKDDQ